MDLTNLNLPDSVVSSYNEIGFHHMFKWQRECLSLPDVFDGKNLVYAAPTGAGKTFVMEIILIKRILKLKGKAILVFPYVSVAREKLFWLQRLFDGTGVIVDGFMGGVSPPGGIDAVDIALCTIEKGNNLINRMIQDNTIGNLCLLAVDELHMIGDENRGYLLELMLTKLRYLALKNTDSKLKVQIIGFSATVSNLALLANWLGAACYETTFRPIPLERFIMCGNIVYDDQLKEIRKLQPISYNKGSDCAITSLCYETTKLKQSVLIFCPSKQWCESLSIRIAGNLSMCTSIAESMLTSNVVKLLKESPAGMVKTLAKTVQYGVAFHHAGLTIEERDVIEQGFRNGDLNVLIATSTLSSGVNLPAGRVIIRTPMFHSKLLSAQVFQQMSGRAGRKGCDDKGECFLMCENNQKSMCQRLLSCPLPVLQSSLMQEHSVSDSIKRAVLEIIGNGIATSTKDIHLYFQSTLLCAKALNEQEADKNSQNTPTLVQTCLDWLEENEFISYSVSQQNMRIINPTKLGKASIISSLSVHQSLTVLADLQVAAKALALDTELHLIYQVTPISAAQDWTKLNWYNYLNVLETLTTSERRVCALVGVDDGFVTRMVATSSKSNRLYRKFERTIDVHTRFYVALILHDLIREVPLSQVCSKFEYNRGFVQSLQQSAASYAGMVTGFCRALGWWSLEMLLNEFQSRLVFGIQRDLVDLMKISALNKERARALYDAGFTTCQEVAASTCEDIESALAKSAKFQTLKKDKRESEFEVEERRKLTLLRLAGSNVLVSFDDAAKYVIKEARALVGRELEVIQTENVVLSQKIQNLPKIEVTSPQKGALDDLDHVNLTLSKLSLEPCNNKVLKNYEAYDLNSIENSFDMFDTSFGSLSNGNGVKNSMEDFSRFMEDWSDQKLFAISFNEDTTSFSEVELMSISCEENSVANVVGISVCWSQSIVYYINLQENDILTKVKGFLSDLDQDTTVVSLHAKETFKLAVRHFKLTLKSKWQDPYVARWMLDSAGESNLQLMAKTKEVQQHHFFTGEKRYALLQTMDEMHNLIQDRFVTDTTLVDEYRYYHLASETSCRLDCEKEPSCSSTCQDVHVAFCAMSNLSATLCDRNLFDFYTDVEMPHVLNVALLELNGITLDLKELRRYKVVLTDALRKLQDAAWKCLGRKFNLYNPTEISQILYKDLGLKSASKCGNSSTSKQVLQSLDRQTNSHPLPGIIVSWRSISHSLNKVVYPLLSVSNASHSEDESTFHHTSCATTTSTGRITMAEPSLQNIPKAFDVKLASDESKNAEESSSWSIQLRDIFIAPQGNLFVSADYSQLELRVMAHLSNDPKLMRLFSSGGDQSADVFCRIASVLLGVEDPTLVSDEQRATTKQVCYGILYGMGPATLSLQLNVTEPKAKDLIETFMNQYPMLKSYLRKLLENCRKNGYIESICGRRRSIPNCSSSDLKVRSAAERQAVNSTVQSSATDIVKSATCKIHDEIRKRDWQVLRPGAFGTKPCCYIVHNLHDELIYEVRHQVVDEFAALMRSCMENALPLEVNLKVKTRVGSTWQQLQDLC